MDAIEQVHGEWRTRFGEIVADLMLHQVKAIRSIHQDSARLPTTDTAITAYLKDHSPKAGSDGKRWAVRGVPMHGGQCTTAGVFSEKADAEVFLCFWGNWVNTEVKLAEVERGINPWTPDTPLDDWERRWAHRVPPRINPPPQLRRFPRPTPPVYPHRRGPC